VPERVPGLDRIVSTDYISSINGKDPLSLQGVIEEKGAAKEEKRMKIAQIAPVCVPVPPVTYGGTERVVSLLTEELVRRGVEVTLFASGDSETSARLDALYPEACGFRGDDARMQLAHLSYAFRRIREEGGYDLIHNHAGIWGITLAREAGIPVVTTLHNDYLPPGSPEFRHFRDACHYVAISDNQRRRLAGLRFAGRVYNGIDVEAFRLRREKCGDLLFVGNICPEKGADTAVRVARDLGRDLLLVGKVDPGEQKRFFEEQVRPHLNGRIRYRPPVGHAEKEAFYREARCFIFPLTWQEPFGLVLAEALACGTPVVAYRKGAVPELVRHGRTGFVVDSYEEFLNAVEKADEIDPDECRRSVERSFSIRSMTDGYLDIYRTLLGEQVAPPHAA